MLRDDSVANAQAQTRSFSDRFRRVEGIENPGSVFHPGSAVGELSTYPVTIEPGAYPNIAFARMFEDGINRVVHHVQKDLLELVWISGGYGQILRQVQGDADVVHAPVIITQRQR